MSNLLELQISDDPDDNTVVDITVCLCKKDDCNSGNFVKSGTFWIALVALVFAF